jgi:hypothetical protein
VREGIRPPFFGLFLPPAFLYRDLRHLAIAERGFADLGCRDCGGSASVDPLPVWSVPASPGQPLTPHRGRWRARFELPPELEVAGLNPAGRIRQHLTARRLAFSCRWNCLWRYLSDLLHHAPVSVGRSCMNRDGLARTGCCQRISSKLQQEWDRSSPDDPSAPRSKAACGEVSCAFLAC